jgi:RNA polymerase sigma-70 factor (ECF subfamily)
MPSAAASSSSLRVPRAVREDAPAPAAETDRERDAGWITRARDGDHEAFRRLVEHYQDRAYRTALGVMGNREEAWDVAQEAFLRVYRSLDRFRLGQNFYTWLYRIVVNLGIDTLRRRGQERLVTLEEIGDCARVDCPPDSELDRDDRSRSVRTVLDCLPPRYRAVLVLRDVEELDCREIARIVGCTHATARWRLHKARRLFREAWERHDRRAARNAGPGRIERGARSATEDRGGVRRES